MSNNQDTVNSVNSDLAKARSALSSAETRAAAAIKSLPTEWAKLIDYETKHPWVGYAAIAVGGLILGLVLGAKL